MCEVRGDSYVHITVLCRDIVNKVDFLVLTKTIKTNKVVQSANYRHSEYVRKGKKKKNLKVILYEYSHF